MQYRKYIRGQKVHIHIFVSDWAFCRRLNFLLLVEHHLNIFTVNQIIFSTSTVINLIWNSIKYQKLNRRRKTQLHTFAFGWIFVSDWNFTSHRPPYGNVYSWSKYFPFLALWASSYGIEWETKKFNGRQIIQIHCFVQNWNFRLRLSFLLRIDFDIVAFMVNKWAYHLMSCKCYYMEISSRLKL